MAQAMASSRAMGSVFWPVVWRFAWKEIRATRGLALGAAGILVALFALFRFAMWSSGARITAEDAEVFVVAAGVVSALYAVAASISAFAAERELRTHTLLFQLPHQWLATGLGKLVAIAGSTLFMAVVFDAMALAFTGGVLPNDFGMLVGNQLVFLIEALAWSLLVSLVCPQPLVGAVIACAMLGVGPYFVTGLVVPNQYIQLPELYEASPQRLIVAAVLMVINVVLIRRWIEQTPGQGRGRRRIFRRRHDAIDDATVDDTRPTSVRGQVRRPSLAGLKLLDVTPFGSLTSFARLVWQAWKLAWRRMLGIVAAAGAFITFMYVMVPAKSDSMVVIPLSIGTAVLPALLGSMVFGGDQREGRYEFLAQHTAPRGKVWLSRVLVPLVPVLAVFLVLGVFVWWVVGEDVSEHFHWSYLWTAALMTALTAFALGQLFSLWTKSEIRAAGLAVAAMVLLLIWSTMASLWRISPWWSLFPIAVGALVATRVDMAGWMNNRRDRSSWARSLATSLLPVAVVVGSVPLVRDWQIERALRQVPAEHVAALHQQRDELESRRDADVRVLAAYRRLRDRIDPRSNPQIMGVLIKNGALSEQEMAELRQLTTMSLFRTTQLLNDSTATALAKEIRQQVHGAKDLDLAWENFLALYRFRGQMLQEGTSGIQHRVRAVVDPELEKATIDFMLRPGQTPERLEAAIEDLREADAAYPPVDRAVMYEYVRTRDFIDGRFVEDVRQQELTHYLPGEESRARKALDVAAAILREDIDRVYQHQPPRAWVSEAAEYLVPERLAAWRTAMTSPAVADWRWTMPSFVEEAGDAKEEAAQRGLEKVRFALVAHHLRHGKYPESLDELPMKLSTLLPDWWPLLERMVEYEPTGHDLPIDVPLSYRNTLRIEPHTSFVWVGGDYARMIKTMAPEDLSRPRVNEEEGEVETEEPQIDVLAIQHPPVPQYARRTSVLVPLPRDEDYPGLPTE